MPYKDPEARKEYARQWMKQRRDAYMADKCCVQCGSTDDLELDHVDPALKVHHRIWSWTARRREAEIEKCQILCHDCHLEKTRLQRFGERAHGEPRMYNRGGCRCEVCVEGIKAYRARLRAEKYSRRAA